MKNKTFTLCLMLFALTACEGYHMPSLTNSNPAGMSDQTLCYRYATATQRSEDLAGEINRRNINCNTVLEDDPLYKGR